MSEGPKRWIDVSRPLSGAIPVWPGDRPFRLETEASGAGLVSAMSTSCHAGTHVDAPRHLDAAAAGVEAVSLDALIGPAEVVLVKPRGRLIEIEDLGAGWAPRVPRVLFRTDSRGMDEPIGDSYPGISPRLVERLVAAGVVCVGTDAPSVDPFASDTLECHHALMRAGMVWLEDLWLEGVPGGYYILVALPVLVVGSDGAPVRAALRPLSPAALEEAHAQW